MSTTKITDDNIYSVNSTKITGAVNASCFPAVLPAVSGANLTNLPGSALGFKNISGWADGETQTISLTSNAGGLGKAAIQVWEEIADPNKTNADWDITTNDSGFDLTDSAYAQTLTPAATTGDSIDFTMGGGTFASTDVGKLITNTSSGETGQAQIISIASNVATCNITTDFTNTDAIASGDWKMFAGEFKDGVFQLNNAGGAGGSGTVQTPTVFESAEVAGNTIVALTDTKFIVWYADFGNNNGAGTACILEVNGNTVTAGTPFVFHNSHVNLSYKNDMTKLSETKVVIVYRDNSNSNKGTAVVLEISGTTITAGPKFVFWSATANYSTVATLTPTKFIISTIDGDWYSHAALVVCTVSGNTITQYGSSMYYRTANYATLDPVICAVSPTKAILVYGDNQNTAIGTAVGITITETLDQYGTNIWVGSPVVYEADSLKKSIIKLSENKAIVVYHDGQNNQYGTACVLNLSGTGSGTTITAGTPFVYESSGTTGNSAHSGVLLGPNKVLVVYKGGSGQTGKACVLNISGNTITSETPFTTAASTNFQHAAVVSGTNAIVTYKDQSGGATNNYGLAVVINFPLPASYVTNQYVTTISGTDSIDTSNYVDLNSMTVTETLNGGTANFAFSTNSTPSSSTVTGGTFFVIGSGQTTTRDIASSLNSVHGGTEGEWYINNNTTYGSTTWVAAATNETKEAISEATAITANQMSGTTVNAVADTTWPALGTQLSVAITLYSTDNSSSPTVDGISFNYDGAMINRDRTGQYVIEMPSVSSIKVTAPSSGGPRNARVYINS